MRFDDRLNTVLAQPAASPHERAVRWRQLVELAARAPSEGESEMLSRAIQEIRDGAPAVDERVRVAAALAVAWLPLPADLVAAFAADRLNVAAPVLASARLTASEWKSVAAVASEDCRAFIATMRSETPVSHFAPEPVSVAEASVATPASAPALTPVPAFTVSERDDNRTIPSISDVVARIERLRQSREFRDVEPPQPAAAPEQARLFRWECNESGEIEWVEGAPRGSLIGQSIAQRGNGTGVDRTVERAFASRAPFHDGTLALPADATAGGRWKLSGVPAFDRSSGRFAGYRGVAERREETESPDDSATHPDALRELAHEIRTPLNAIIGFAEIITGEYLGPAGTRYRERAAEIVEQARLLLAAVEDLDFAARVHSSVSEDAKRTALGSLMERLSGTIRELGAARGVEIDISVARSEISAAVQPDIAERLILRMCTAVLSRASAGEHLRLSVDRDGNHCSVSISRPRALRDLSHEDLFGASNNALSPGFPLRLARGLALTAGAALVTSDQGITLRFACA